MNKNKKYFPNFKVAQPDMLDDAQPEETVEDFMKTQESYDDSAFEKDLSGEEMGEVTSPET
eukprot:10594219-Alexandrium_andersonii.AAC.1